MSNYVCVACGSLFDQPADFIETHGLDTPPYEHIYTSPCCHENFVEARYCSGCDEVITTETYVQVQNGERYCEQCFSLHQLEDDV